MRATVSRVKGTDNPDASISNEDGVRDSLESELNVQIPWRKVFVGGILVTGVAIAVTVGILGSKVWRVERTEHALQSVNADYRWIHQHFDEAMTKPPQWTQQKLAEWFGNSVTSEFGMVSIQSGDPNDEQLDFIPDLKGVRSLELRSNTATDHTVAMISQLPNLRYLTLIGNNFTIMGLLQLRAATNLCQLRVEKEQFSAIELAVLQAELPSVVLADASNDMVPPQRTLYGNLEPAA